MERRREPRETVVLRVEYGSPQALLADYATDIGTGGLFLRTDLPLSPGDPLRLTVSFPGMLERTTVNVTVRWRRSAEQARLSPGSEPAGVGVSFDQGQEAALRPILELIERMRAPARSLKQRKDQVFDVLLVEDNRFVQDLFRHALQRFHADRPEHSELRIHTAFTGHEALRMASSLEPDLAIIDHFLPGMTGAALVRHLRGRPGLSNLPILVVSTGGREVRGEALESGATVYLDKPVLLTRLVSTIRAMVAEEVPA